MPKGDITHIEFPADDTDRAQRFYTAVAGWQFSEMDGMPGYFVFRSGEDRGGAIARRGESTGQALRIYITVDSMDEAIAASEANGGTIIEQPADIGGGMGIFAVVRDPEGTEVGLWQEDRTGAD
jgi:uncharacterized protein